VRRVARLLGLALSGAALAGCSLVPAGGEPVTVGRSNVPFGLLGESIPGTNHGHVHFITQPVFMVDAAGNLAPSSRIVPSPATLDSLLRELLIGPTIIERSAGISSALPRDLVLLQATVARGLARVSLAAPLAGLTGRDELLALGQLVLTAQAVGATKGTEVMVGGVPLSLPTPAGDLETVLTPGAFQRLLGR
jgi:hypothetical protein